MSLADGGVPYLDILHEDSDLLVVDKPADLVCHPTKGDVFSSLVSRVRLHLGPGAESHLINRLDRESTGVVLVAKRLEVARAWREIWERREVTKRYEAIVEGHLSLESGSIEAPLGKDVGSQVAIKDCVRPDGAPSVTHYRVLTRFERRGELFTHLEVMPHSGRKHQIRIHLSHLGHPIVGDKIYGPDEQIYLRFVVGQLSDAQRDQLRLPNHALHASTVEAGCLGRNWRFHCDPPAGFLQFLGPCT